MHKRILLFLHQYRREFVATAISTLVFVVLIATSGLYLNRVNSFFVRGQSVSVDSVIQQELAYLSLQREAIIASKVLNDDLRSGDADRLLTEARFEAKKRGFDFIVVIDKNGFVLTRTHLPRRVGDNIFQTTVQGARIAQGETVTAVIRGVNNPLTSMSGSLVLEDGKVIGALIVGNIINNAYAERLKMRYLDDHDDTAEVLFYANKIGMIGSSIEDPETNHLLNLFFSSGSDLVTRQVPQLASELKIHGQYYFPYNSPFPDFGGRSPGGVVVLMPVSHIVRSALYASLLVLVFLFSYGYLPRLRWFRGERHDSHLALFITLVLFFVFYTAHYIRLDRAATELKDSPYPIYNSTLRFVPDSGIIYPSVKTDIAIRLLTGGEAINDVRATIQYDPKKLKVADILSVGSVCKPDGFLEKTIDNKAGLVKINCVTSTINPGFYEPEGTVAELAIVPLVEGGGSLKFVDKTQVLANDGLETNVLRSTTDAFYQITRQGLVSLDIKDTIPVFSPSHPNSNHWYRQKSVELSWPVLKGGTYFYVLNQTPDSIPDTNNASTTSDRLNTTLATDGVYYFHIRSRSTSGKWGPASHFKILVDSTPPATPLIQNSAVKTNSGELVRFSFSGSDTTSGVQRNFYVRFDNGTWFPTLPQLYVPFFSGEKHTVSLRVFDNAGNFSDSSIDIVAP